jgi:nucleotide-binding universal stress UspA family protein
MFQKVFVPLDGSELAEAALDYVRGLGATHLHLFRVQAYPALSSLPLDMPATESLLEAERSASTTYLQDVSQRLSGPRLSVTWSQRIGDPASAILQEAKDEGADCIVMSSHGRTGWSRFLLGSVAEKVMRHATCPVLLVRQGVLQMGQGGPATMSKQEVC